MLDKPLSELSQFCDAPIPPLHPFFMFIYLFLVNIIYIYISIRI